MIRDIKWKIVGDLVFSFFRMFKKKIVENKVLEPSCCGVKNTYIKRMIFFSFSSNEHPLIFIKKK